MIKYQFLSRLFYFGLLLFFGVSLLPPHTEIRGYSDSYLSWFWIFLIPFVLILFLLLGGMDVVQKRGYKALMRRSIYLLLCGLLVMGYWLYEAKKAGNF